MTVALPILSACGIETCILPTAVLSTHTGGFQNYTVHDLAGEIPAIIAHWQKEAILFDAVYTGYLQNGDAFSAAKTAADYTLSCIENTLDDAEHWYGVKFEPELPGLMRSMIKGEA